MLPSIKIDTIRDFARAQVNLAAPRTIAQLDNSKPSQTDTKKLTASIAKSDSANALERLAEEEFEKQFSSICTIAQKPTKVPKSAMLNLPFLKKIVEKYRQYFEVFEDDVTENSSLVASRANVQLGDSKASQSETKPQDEIVAQPKSAKRGN